MSDNPRAPVETRTAKLVTRTQDRPAEPLEVGGASPSARSAFGARTDEPDQPAGQNQTKFGGASPSARSAFGARTDKPDEPTGETKRSLVEPDGIEPTTSCLQSRRSPN